MQQCVRVKKVRERKKYSSSTVRQSTVMQAMTKNLQKAIEEKERTMELQSKFVVPPPLPYCDCKLGQSLEGFKEFNRQNSDYLLQLLPLMFIFRPKPITLVHFFECYLEASIQEEIDDNDFDVQSVFDKWRSAGGHTCQVNQLLEKAKDWERRVLRREEEEEETFPTEQKRVTLPPVGACNCGSGHLYDFYIQHQQQFRELEDQFDFIKDPSMTKFGMFGQVVSGYAGVPLSAEELTTIRTKWEAGGSHLCQIKTMLDNTVPPTTPPVSGNVTTTAQAHLPGIQQEETVESLKERLKRAETRAQQANLKMEALEKKLEQKELEAADDQRKQKHKDCLRVFETLNPSNADKDTANCEEFREERGEKYQSETEEGSGLRDVERGKRRSRKSRTKKDYNCILCICLLLVVFGLFVFFLIFDKIL